MEIEFFWVHEPGGNVEQCQPSDVTLPTTT